MKFLVGNTWSDPASWSPVGVPQSGDSVTINHSFSGFDIPHLEIEDLVVTTPGWITGMYTNTLVVAGDITVIKGQNSSSEQLLVVGATVELAAGPHTLNVGTDADVSIADLGGPGSIVKTGPGRADVRGDFSGPVDIQMGVVTSSFGSAVSGTTVRAGATAETAGYAADAFTVYSGTTSSPTALFGLFTGPIATVGAGVVRVFGNFSGVVSGPASVVVDRVGSIGSPTVMSGANTYSGGTTVTDLEWLQVDGESPLGSGSLVMSGTGPERVQLEVRPGALVTNPISATGGRIHVVDDGVSDIPELSGPLELETDLLLVMQVPPPASGAVVLSGPVSGDGTLIVHGSGQPDEVVLTGAEPTTNAGVQVSGRADLTLYLVKPAGVDAVSGSLQIDSFTDVVWLADEQVAEDASASGDGGFFLNGMNETMGSLDLAGELVLSSLGELGYGSLDVEDLTAHSNASLEFSVGAAESDLLTVRGSLVLDGAALDVVAVDAVSMNSIKLVNVSSDSPVVGTFAGLPEGAPVQLGDRVMNITYVGGDGNDMSLIAEPNVSFVSFVSLVPGRLLDSRSPGGSTVDGDFAAVGFRAAGTVTELLVAGRGGVPGDASAVVLNVTATVPAGGGFLTVWPCGSQMPNASSLNFAGGQTIANAVVAKVGVGGKVCIFTSATTHLITDVNGYFP